MNTADKVLHAMADTYAVRNAVYGDNFKTVGPVMKLLHPRGVVLATAADHELFHLWSLVIVKITRFANSNLAHTDSAHDAAVYLAMIEAILNDRATACEAHQMGDRMGCKRCDMSWDTNDPAPPTCPKEFP